MIDRRPASAATHRWCLAPITGERTSPGRQVDQWQARSLTSRFTGRRDHLKRTLGRLGVSAAVASVLVLSQMDRITRAGHVNLVLLGIVVLGLVFRFRATAQNSRAQEQEHQPCSLHEKHGTVNGYERYFSSCCFVPSAVGRFHLQLKGSS